MTAPAEMRTALVRRARKVYRELVNTYPDAHCELDFANPLQLLVATMLSAQCTDVRVNQVTPALFRAYPTAAAYASADRAELETLIAPTGFFRTKAAHIQEAAAILCEQYAGEVPADLDALVKLPGVGRKTANVVLGNAFDIPGLTVDTHVGRLSRRLGWTQHSDPVKVERDLDALFPAKDHTMLCHVLIFHGRRCCYARKPDCGSCSVSRWCPSKGVAA